MAESTRTTPGSPSGSPYSGASTPVPPGSRQGEKSSAQGGDSAAHVVEDAKEMGSELIGAARDSAASMLDMQRNRAADQISAVAQALRDSTESLDRNSAGAVVRYADQAARQISDFAEVVRSRSWSELADDAETFARRWPLAFMASAVGIGFIAGRFMLSSAGQARQHNAVQGTDVASHSAGTTGTAAPRTTAGETPHGALAREGRAGGAGASGTMKPGQVSPGQVSPGSSTNVHRP
jgi:hypothetical protein